MMSRRKLLPVAEWLRVIQRDAVEGFAVGFDEPERTVIEDLNDYAAFMHFAMTVLRSS